MYSKYHKKYVQADVRFANTYFILEKTILVKQMGKVTTIGINRPEKRNCLDVATAHLLSKALDEFENNEESLVGVLYGEGGNFCAGYDLKEIANYDGENEESIPHFGPLVYSIYI